MYLVKGKAIVYCKPIEFREGKNKVNGKLKCGKGESYTFKFAATFVAYYFILFS